MKKMLSLLLAMLMLTSLCAAANAEAAEAIDPAAQLLADVAGTYEELFTVICGEEYDQLWLDNCAAAVGEEGAPMIAQMLKSACTGELYGEEAIQAYADENATPQFDCFFIGGVNRITFEGNTISGTDAEGNTVFSHEYEPAGEFSIAGMMDGYLYETKDADAGDFTYFLLMPDTPATTQHIEFRYGSNTEDLAKYDEGSLAYWLAAGILTDRDEQMVKDVIALFCSENLAELEEDAVKEAVEISNADELAAISNDLSGDYVLTADIDLSGIEWTPIGTYAPSGESAEESEIPDPAYAFTGSFDGNGHTISHLKVAEGNGIARGLFGCAANAEIGNFKLDGATVDGGIMTADVLGYGFGSYVYGIELTGGVVNGHPSEMSSEGMFGGIVGAGMGTRIENCSAAADITISDGQANAGIIGGGLELTSVVGCTASGTVTAGNDCYGLGGISGCGFGAEEFTDCVAKDVTITAGTNTRWIGGVTGYAGGYEDESWGVPVTVFSGCASENVSFVLGEGSEEAGEIVGAGFYSEEAAQALGTPYDAPTVYVIK